MKTVLAFGCFDILHVGHLEFLKRCKELGDRLVVVVARDSTIRKGKGREPFFDEEARRMLVESLDFVETAFLGNEDGEAEKYKVIGELKPDVIALGYDQQEAEEKLKQKLSEMGLKAEVVRVKHVENDEVFKSSKTMDRLRACVLRDI